jgi:diacylglycerol kinase family enzyme
MPAAADVIQDVALILTLAAVLAVVALAVGVLLLLRGRRTVETGLAPQAPRESHLAPPTAALIVNPTKLDGTSGAAAWFAETCRAHGFGPPLLLETSAEDPGTGQAGAALAAGACVVLALGGDGTVRAVAERLAGSGVPLGLLPAGTGNLLARNLDVPLTNRDEAAHTALAGIDKPVDIGRVVIDVSGEDQRPQRRTFMVMAGLGFDAEVMAAVEPRLKERVGWLAYVVAGARRLRGAATRVSIHLDGEPALSRRVRSVIIGNCGQLTGGLQLMPAAEVDDGLLDVVAVTARGPMGWAGVVGTVVTRSRLGHPFVEHFRCRVVEIRADRPLAVQLDGDTAGIARRLHAEVDPLALVVRVKSA